MVKVVAVLGSSGSGKTYTVEHLLAGLTRRGFRVGSAKHVHHPDFTIDVEGKDTWRHRRAGASRIVILAEEEVTVLRKERGSSYTLEKLLSLFEDGDFDIVILEGFHWLVSQMEDVEKIIAAKDLDDLERRLEGTRPPVTAVTGIVAKGGSLESYRGIPVIDVEREGERLVEMVSATVSRLPAGTSR